jgi:CRP-like cAMP-binding protein
MPVDFTVFKDAAPYRGFKEADWKLFSGIFQEKTIPAGAYVFKENDPGDGLFLIRSGKIRISRRVVHEGKRETSEQLLTVLISGNLFGEMALVENEPRSADAVAESDAVLFWLPHAEYVSLKTEHPATALRVQDLIVVTLCSRIREANHSFETIRFWCT